MQRIVNIEERYKEIQDSLNLETNIKRKRAWVNFFIKRGFLNKDTYDFLQQLSEKLELIYPDKWDIQLVVDRTNYAKEHDTTKVYSDDMYRWLIVDFTFIIKFDSFDITNEENKSHHIKDLFVKVNFSVKSSNKYILDEKGNQVLLEDKDYNIHLHRVSGVRTTLSVVEYLGNYVHSHIDEYPSFTSYKLNYAKFCTGEGEINQFRNILKNNLDLNYLEMYLHQIKVLVEYESIEGRPYRYIKNIHSNASDTNSVPHKLGSSEIIFFGNQIIDYNKNNRNIGVNWIIEKEEFKIKDDERLEEYCLIYENSISSYPDTHIVLKTENGTCIRLPNRQKLINLKESLDNELQLKNKGFIVFRNEKYYLTIEGEIPEIDDNQKIYIHPKIKEYVRNTLQSRVQEEKIRDAINYRLENKNRYAQVGTQ